MNIVDMKQLSDELRFIANNVNAVCSFWEKVGTPAKNEEVSMYGFFTSEQLATIADKIDAIIEEQHAGEWANVEDNPADRESRSLAA